MAGIEDDERERLMADAKTATLAGGGMGFAFLGLVAVPLLSILGLALSFAAFRIARPGYRTGRNVAIGGMALGIFGLGTWLTLTFMAG